MSTTTPDETDGSTLDGVDTVLTGGTHSGENRLHLPSEDDNGTLCGCVEPRLGWMERPLDSYPESCRRWCKRCRAKAKTGRSDPGNHQGTKPCPQCGEDIGTSVWPQHFVACDGGTDER